MNIDWIRIIINLKEESLKIQDFSSATEFREIERWLKFKHPIEEIFENKNAYNEVVKRELLKMERKKKINKLNENNN